MKYFSKYVTYFCYLMVVFLFLFVIAFGNKKMTATVSNINSTKSVPATSIYNIYTSSPLKKQFVVYPTFNEAIANASNGNSSFIGKLTGYGLIVRDVVVGLLARVKMLVVVIFIIMMILTVKLG